MSKHAVLTLYIEIFTNEQDERILDLLSFPASVALLVTPKFKVVDEGKTGARRVKDVGSFVGALRRERFTEASVSYPAVNWDGVELAGIQQVLLPAPTCSLWKLTDEWEPQSRLRKHREYATLKSQEDYLKWNDVSCFPSCLITTVSFADETFPSVDGAYVWAKRFIRACFPHNLSDKNLVGGGGIDVFDESTRNYLYLTPRASTSLMPWPKAFPALGDKFGVLQPLMLARLSLCTVLHDSLKGVSELLVLQHSTSLGLVHISPSAITDSAVSESASAVLVHRNETTARRSR